MASPEFPSDPYAQPTGSGNSRAPAPIWQGRLVAAHPPG